MKNETKLVIGGVVILAALVIGIYITNPQAYRGLAQAPNNLDQRNLGISLYPDKAVINLYQANLYVTSTACTESMLPVFNCNDTLVMENISSTTQVNIGDWISYFDSSKNKTIIHSVISYESPHDCYYFQGSNNLVVDARCIKRENMIGRVVALFPTTSPWNAAQAG